jgi:putative transposase
MVEDMLAARGIEVSHETIRNWAEKFGRDFASSIRRRAPKFGDAWYLDEVAITIAGKKHSLLPNFRWRPFITIKFAQLDGAIATDALVATRRRSPAAGSLRRLQWRVRFRLRTEVPTS